MKNIQEVGYSDHNELFGEILNLKGDITFEIILYVENPDPERPGSFLKVMFWLNIIRLA